MGLKEGRGGESEVEMDTLVLTTSPSPMIALKGLYAVHVIGDTAHNGVREITDMVKNREGRGDGRGDGGGDGGGGG